MGKDRKTVHTYGRHRQRIISCDVWKNAVQEEKKHVFSTSSSIDSFNSTHNNSSTLFSTRPNTRARRKIANKENTDIVTGRSRRAVTSKKYNYSGDKDCCSSSGSDSLFSSRQRQALQTRNTNAQRTYGKRKKDVSLEYNMFKNKKLPPKDSSSSGSAYNFSEFDDYSLVISRDSPVQKVVKNKRSVVNTSPANHERPVIETSTPFSKRMQVSTPFSSKIRDNNISHIEHIEDSPLVTQETKIKSVTDDLGTPLSREGDLERLGISSIMLGTPNTDISDLECAPGRRARHSLNSSGGSYKSPLSACVIQIEKLSESLISLHLSKEKKPGKHTRSNPVNFTNSRSLFSSVNTTDKDTRISDDEEDDDGDDDEEEEEDDDDDDDDYYEEEDDEDDDDDDTGNVLNDIVENEEEDDSDNNTSTEVLEEAEATSLSINNSTHFMLPDNSYLQPSTENSELSVIYSMDLSIYSTADSDNSLSFHTAEDDNCEDCVQDLNKSVFEMLTPSKAKLGVLEMSSRSKVLEVCEQEDTVTFDAVFPDSMMKICKKVGEGVYGEVFRTQNCGKWVAIKIIPIEGSFEVNDEPQKTFEEILPEIVISKELSLLKNCKDIHTSNFCQVHRVSCVQGKYPDELLHQWDIYKKNKYSENDRPDIFNEEQLFIVFEFADGGTDLESCQFENILEAKSVLSQVAFSLAVAEEQLYFEHRDLHWGNVLVKRTDEKFIEYRLLGENIKLESNKVSVCIIDFTLSRLKKDECTVYNNLATDETLFEGTGDLQFAVYRDMKTLNGNNWEPFNPRTNVLWLHYLADKLVRSKRYARKTRKDQEVLREFRLFLKNMLDFNSACELVACSEFLRS